MSTTHLYICGDSDRTREGNNLSVQTPHGQYLLAVAAEGDAVYTSKEFLEVGLYDLWLCGLTQDLQKVLISDKVEPWKGRALLLM